MQVSHPGSSRSRDEAVHGPYDGSRRAAVIDIGSNTIHLLVADCLPDRIRPIRRRRVRARLGIAVADTGALGGRRIRAATSVVQAFAVEARAARAREVLVLGTHAVRAATDRGALAQAVEAATGLTVHVLNPEQEAQLCLAGAELGPLPPPPFLSVDIGGGSCDVSAVEAAGIRGVVSVAVGSGVLAARDLDGDPPSRIQLDRTAARLMTLFRARHLPGEPEFTEVVATGGAARRLQRQLIGEHGAGPAWTSDLLELAGWLLRMPSSLWPHPVKPGRAATARAGGLILQTIAIRWQVARWRISPFGLREGALARWARGLRLETADAEDAQPARTQRLGGRHGH
jgi:exopolyphosphatase/guanosine-5'-triphosphate,3'-diphosphate pyrophosphatase